MKPMSQGWTVGRTVPVAPWWLTLTNLEYVVRFPSPFSAPWPAWTRPRAKQVVLPARHPAVRPGIGPECPRHKGSSPLAGGGKSGSTPRSSA